MEPILMGELSEEEIDLKVVECIVKNIETSQVSSQLIRKLMKKGLYYLAWHFVKNENSPQFELNQKVDIVQKL